jgi:hypothetical protein
MSSAPQQLPTTFRSMYVSGSFFKIHFGYLCLAKGSPKIVRKSGLTVFGGGGKTAARDRSAIFA